MKKFLLGTLGLAAMAAPALAADLPAAYKAPSVVTPVYDWTGFYIGGNGGWGQVNHCWDVDVAGVFAREGCLNSQGGVVGGQVGYRWQTGTWVFGVEAQGDWADFKGSNASLFVLGTTNQSKTNAVGLFTGQVFIGAAVALVPGNLIQLLVEAQVLNGIITPILLTYVLVLANRASVLGDARNGRVFRIVATISVAVVAVLSATVLVQAVLSVLGLS